MQETRRSPLCSSLLSSSPFHYWVTLCQKPLHFFFSFHRFFFIGIGTKFALNTIALIDGFRKCNAIMSLISLVARSITSPTRFHSREYIFEKSHQLCLAKNKQCLLSYDFFLFRKDYLFLLYSFNKNQSRQCTKRGKNSGYSQFKNKSLNLNR